MPGKLIKAGIDFDDGSWVDDGGRIHWGPKPSDKPKPMVKTKECECGAKHTKFPNFHATWCPLYKEHI